MRNRNQKCAALIGSAAAIAVATIASRAGAQSMQSQLLGNPSFESPVDNSGVNTDSTATGWNFYSSADRAEFAAHTGTWGVWEETFAPSGNLGGVYQNVGPYQGGLSQGQTGQNTQPITAGDTYTLTAWEFWEVNAPTVPGLVSDLALTFLNSSGSIVGTTDANDFSDALYQPATSATTGSWNQYTVTGVAPAGATTVQASFDFVVNGPTTGGNLGVFVDDADLSGVGFAVPGGVWATPNSGDWNAGGNWSTGSVPNGIGVSATFGSVITTQQTVYTNTAITVGSLSFDNPNEYEITGTGNLTLQTTTGNATVSVNQGTDILDLPITVASNTVLTVNSGANLIVANPITIDSGKTLTESGTGTVTFQSIITVQSAASIAFSNSTYANTLSVASTGKASITNAAGGVVVKVDNFSNAGTVDVANNELLINYGSGADPIASVASQIASGYNHGSWNGTGIISSIAAIVPGYGLGYADSADPGNPANLASGSIEVKYTLLGDTNLDGVVNAVDFGILAANFNKGVNGWDKGDFNYDNVVNAVDFGDLAANFNKGASGAAFGPGALSDPALVAFAQANGLMADVPEPASLGLLAAGALAAMARRRRRA
jgi:hypothetical protein